MADEKRTLSQLQSLFADNTTRAISAQDLRDFLVSVYGSRRQATVSADTTIDLNYDVISVNASGGSRTITLPTASNNGGKTYLIKKIDSTTNYVKVDANGSETIDGELSQFLLVQHQSLEVISDGTNWQILTGGYRNSPVRIWEQTNNASLPASVANTNVLTTTGVGSRIIPAGMFSVGMKAHFELYGEAENAANTFDVETHFTVGGTVTDSDTVNNSETWSSGALAKLEFDLVCRTVGATGTFSLKGRLMVANNLVVETHDPTLIVVDTTIDNEFMISIETATSFFDSFVITNASITVSK